MSVGMSWTPGWTAPWASWTSGEDLDKIQEFLDTRLTPGSGFSFTSMMKSLLTGDLKSVLGQAGMGLKNSLVSEVHSAGSLLAQVVVIGMVGRCSPIFPPYLK